MSLQNYWYIAAESKELKKKPLVSRVFDQNIVFFRGEDGCVRALQDRCAHRNLPLSLGKVHQNCIECSYHGWRYDGEGVCTDVPALVDGCIPEKVKVKSYKCCEKQGFIWVYMGDGAPDFEPYEFPFLGEKHWYTFVMKTRFQSSVEACLENFLDCPHTVYVHKTLFRSSDTQAITARVVKEPSSVYAEFEGEPMSDSVVSRLLQCNGKAVEHTDRFVVPNISRVDYRFSGTRHFLVTSQCTPISDHETEVYTAMTYRFGNLGWAVRPFFEPLSRRIIKQDVDILEHHGNQMKEYGGASYRNVETDLLGLHIQSLRKMAQRGGVPPEGETERTIQIRF